MANALPPRLDGDTIPVIMKAIGTPLKGDAELHLLAEMPVPVSQRLSSTTVTTAANAVFAPADVTTLTAVLTKKKATK